MSKHQATNRAARKGGGGTVGQDPVDRFKSKRAKYWEERGGEKNRQRAQRETLKEAT